MSHELSADLVAIAKRGGYILTRWPGAIRAIYGGLVKNQRACERYTLTRTLLPGYKTI